MNAKKRISIKGEVINEPSVWTSNNGTACVKFSVRNKDGLFECIGFHERANIEGLAMGCVIAIRGSYRDTEAFESKTITIDAAVVEGGKVTATDAIVAEYGSVKQYEEFVRKMAEYKVSQGLIRAKYRMYDRSGELVVRQAWFAKERCSRHPITREPWLNIDLCMDVLGAKEVSDRLNKTSKSVKELREAMDEMLMEVGDVLSQEAPF